MIYDEQEKNGKTVRRLIIAEKYKRSSKKVQPSHVQTLRAPHTSKGLKEAKQICKTQNEGK